MTESSRKGLNVSGTGVCRAGFLAPLLLILPAVAGCSSAPTSSAPTVNQTIALCRRHPQIVRHTSIQGYFVPSGGSGPRPGGSLFQSADLAQRFRADEPIFTLVDVASRQIDGRGWYPGGDHVAMTGLLECGRPSDVPSFVWSTGRSL